MLILSMSIFGSVGIFKKFIYMPSGLISFARAFIGVIFILLYMLIAGHKISFSSIRKNAPQLIISGIMLGFNWILLFEAIDKTGVPVATICYYFAPVFVMIVSPFLLKEKLGVKKTLCIILALFGMILVANVFDGDAKINTVGIFLGIGAAVLYASIVLANKTVKEISAFDRTAVQLGVSAAIMLIYTLCTTDFSTVSFTTKNVILLIVIGCIHTGLAYTLYFASMEHLSAQTISLFSYFDPVLACILASIIFPSDRMNALQILGSVIVLGATLACEISIKKKGNNYNA